MSAPRNELSGSRVGGISESMEWRFEPRSDGVASAFGITVGTAIVRRRRDELVQRHALGSRDYCAANFAVGEVDDFGAAQ